MKTIDRAFNDSIEYYDEWVRKALPNYKEIFGTALELLPYPSDSEINVLDLGAGTGLFSMHVLEKYPKASFILCDLAEKMMGVAKDRFNKTADQFSYVIGDYRTIEFLNDFDLVISSLSIHHLEDEEKKDLFHKIHGLLRKKGIFINIDQIKGETQSLQELYWNHWLNQVRNEGASEEQIQESILRRTTYDRDASLFDQLQWLKDAGFNQTDCVYKNFFIGVFLATRQ
jgi:tRNA (cmo5U34)-methyltransferase